MNYKTIEYRKKEHIGLISFRGDIGKHDVIMRLADEVSDISELVSSEADIWLVVLMGIGTLSTIMELDSNADSIEYQDKGEFTPPSMVESIANIEKPVIAGMDGTALDQSLELLLACDVRIVTEDSHFGLSQVKKNRIPRHGGTQRLPRLVGRGKAFEMLLIGETMDAREAHRIGLVNKVVPKKDLDKMTMEIAQEMASKSPIALRYAKEAINTGMDLTLDQGLHLEADLYMLLHTSQDRSEGIRAFQERRKPEFIGK